MSVTQFATRHNPFTGESLIKLVPIPVACGRSLKGGTKYDDEFMGILDCTQALRIPESEFQAMRKALYRFMTNHGIQHSHSVRQYKNRKTKNYSLWLVNEPPKTRRKA